MVPPLPKVPLAARTCIAAAPYPVASAGASSRGGSADRSRGRSEPRRQAQVEAAPIRRFARYSSDEGKLNHVGMANGSPGGHCTALNHMRPGEFERRVETG